jgi:hypothetical protein
VLAEEDRPALLEIVRRLDGNPSPWSWRLHAWVFCRPASSSAASTRDSGCW